MDLLCRADEQTIRARTLETLRLAEDYRGVAIGSGNSIADYVPVEKFLAMVQAVRQYRGA
jgi:uroporphyrinogen decarboxylase